MTSGAWPVPRGRRSVELGLACNRHNHKASLTWVVSRRKIDFGVVISKGFIWRHIVTHALLEAKNPIQRVAHTIKSQ